MSRLFLSRNIEDGNARAGAALQVEVSIVNIVTGAARKTQTVAGVGKGGGTAMIRPLISWPLREIDPATELITTRLLDPDTSARDGASADSSLAHTVHPLLAPAQMAWAFVPRKEVSVHVGSRTPASAAVAGSPSSPAAGLTITVKNSAEVPLFYALLTSTLPGRFQPNLLYIPPGSSSTAAFIFAKSSGATSKAPTAADLQNSIQIDWLNRS
jgi:hypothetical protein